MNIHYIYINKHDKHDETLPIEIENLIETYQDVHQGDAKVNVHGYHSLYTEIKKFDPELAEHFDLIDPIFANVISNIGRIFCMYKYGGLYHDVNWLIKNRGAYIELCDLLSQNDITFERHPKLHEKSQVIRNSNMWTAVAHQDLFKNILETQKQNLIRMKSELELNPEVKHRSLRETGVKCIIDEIMLRSQANFTPKPKHKKLNPLYQLIDLIGQSQDLEKVDYSLQLGSLNVGIIQLARFFENNKKFYNKNKEDHWSVYQKTRPILNLNSLHS